ncbi:MAG TPA: VWA domain-containing protein [Candidatus Acidoferrum sp.]|nr:VWA domain-containing protein [Candidatus Acidoferrum sp.]
MPQAGAVLKVQVRTVLVDVLVTNKKGAPITGLNKDAFEVKEDGSPQIINSFEEHSSAPPSTVSQEVLPSGVYTSAQTFHASDSVNVLLLDWLNTQPPDQSYVREQVIKYLRTVPPGTRLGIFALGSELQLVQGFTSESSLLLAALQEKKSGANPKFGRLLSSETRKASEQELADLMVKSDAAPIAVAAVRDSQAQNASAQAGDRVKLTLQALVELERYLSPIPGRKNVFWFSGSFPISVFPGAAQGANFGGELGSAAARFGPDRIAIYPILAAGTTADTAFDPSEGLEHRARMKTATEAAQDPSPAPDQVAMATLARETGGEPFLNTNDIGRDLRRALDDGSHYYTLSYSPTKTQDDGKFRSIDVSVLSKNYRLSYRRGYFAEPPAATPNTEGDRLLSLMRFGMPDFDQLPYTARVAVEEHQPAPGAARAGVSTTLKPPVTRYGVDFLIPLQSLKLESDRLGSQHDNIELMLVAYSKNGEPLNLVAGKEQIKLSRELAESGRNIQIHARQEIDLPVGELFLRAGVYEPASGKAGTIGIAVNPRTSVPSITK